MKLNTPCVPIPPTPSWPNHGLVWGSQCVMWQGKEKNPLCMRKIQHQHLAQGKIIIVYEKRHEPLIREETRYFLIKLIKLQCQ